MNGNGQMINFTQNIFNKILKMKRGNKCIIKPQEKGKYMHAKPLT